MTTTAPHEPSGVEVGVGVQLVAAIRGLHGEVRELRRDQQRRALAQSILPRMVTLPFFDTSGNNGQYATGVNTVLTLDGPQASKVWDVHRLALGGAKANVAALTGTAYGFVGVAVPTDLSLIGLFAVNTTWSPTPPLTWGRGIVQVNAGENLYIIIVGGTNGATYSAAATIREYDRNRYLGAGQLGSD